MRSLRWFIVAVFMLTTMSLVYAQSDEFELEALANGDTVNDSFEEEVIFRLYAFYASAGDTVSIAMSQTEDNLDPFMVLLDSEGAVLAYDDDSGSNLSALIDSYTIEADGAYFILATGADYIDGSEIEAQEEQGYTLSIIGQNTPSDIEDADTVTLEVNTLTLGSSSTGESSEDNAAAFFFFAGQSGDSLSLSLEDADFYSVLYVFAPDGSLVGTDPSQVNLDLEDDGVYLIIATDAFFFEAIDSNGGFEGGNFSLEVN